MRTARKRTPRSLPWIAASEPSGCGVTYYAQSRRISKSSCKSAVFRTTTRRPSEARVVERLHDLEHGGEVLVAEPPAGGGGVELAGERGGRERGAGVARLLEAEADVLEHVVELEQRREVVGQHRLALELEHRRVRRAAGHDGQQRLEVDAAPPADPD